MNNPLSDVFIDFIRRQTGAEQVAVEHNIQTLWSGYGHILRLSLTHCDRRHLVVKHVQFPQSVQHPRGWHSHTSHQRKMRSYEVEICWYQQWSNSCDQAFRVAECLGVMSYGSEHLILLEDLDESGFSVRVQNSTLEQIRPCVAWLARFHANFLGRNPKGLWPIGTYWHLGTRPDELAAMPEGKLKDSAQALDQRLGDCEFKTIVHGDAKIANFCFSDEGTEVAAVDFQYVGGGCGIKDLVYFISSCLDETACEKYAPEILDYYFDVLRHAIGQRDQSINVDALEMEWRTLYPLAWADFYRFLLGWSPGHWKIHGYSARMVDLALAQLTV